MGPKPSKEEGKSALSSKLSNNPFLSPLHPSEEKLEPLKFLIILEKIKCKNLTHVFFSLFYRVIIKKTPFKKSDIMLEFNFNDEKIIRTSRIPNQIDPKVKENLNKSLY